MPVYTLGTWTIKDGRADDFVRAWNNLAVATKNDFPNERAVLLRDHDNPNLFYSLGPWESLEQIGAWRESATFTQGIGTLVETSEEFVPHTMDVAASIDWL